MRAHHDHREYRTITGLKHAAILLLVCGAWGVLTAYAAPIDEAEFWRRLERSAEILAAGDETQRETTLTELRDLWGEVDAVQLTEGASVRIDMGWLTERDTPLDQLARDVNGLLNFHARGSRLSDLNVQAMLAELNRVLQDARFQYPTPTPVTPNNMPDERAPNSDLLPSAELSQIILLVVGVLAVFVVLVYFGRGLQVQPIVPNNGDDSEDPTTSTQAHEMAQLSEAASDYRTAIRYLYLASLLLLDERGALRYDPALTNRELLRQVRSKDTLHELLRVIVQTFDRVWYGFAPVDAALYGEFRQQVEQLQRAAIL